MRDSAASLQAFSSREVRRTLAPAEAKPEAIIRPIPLDPPVISTFFPATENRFDIGMVVCSSSTWVNDTCCFYRLVIFGLHTLSLAQFLQADTVCFIRAMIFHVQNLRGKSRQQDRRLSSRLSPHLPFSQCDDTLSCISNSIIHHITSHHITILYYNTIMVTAKVIAAAVPDEDSDVEIEGALCCGVVLCCTLACGTCGVISVGALRVV